MTNNLTHNTLQILKTSWRLLGHHQRSLPWVLFISIFIGLLDMLGVALFGPFVASIITPDVIKERAWYQFIANYSGMAGENPTLTMAVIMVAVFSLRLFSAILLLRKIYRYCSLVDRDLRYRLMARYYSIDLSYLAESSSANVVQMVHGFTAQFAYGLVGGQLRSFTEILIGIAILLYLFYLNPVALLLLVLLVMGLIIIYDHLLKKRIHNYGYENIRLGKILIRAVQQVAMGIREIRIYGVDGRLLNAAKEAAAQSAKLQSHYQWLQALPKYLIEFFLMTTVCLLVLFLQQQDMAKEEMFALMGVFGIAMMRLTPAANYVITVLSQLRFMDHVVGELAKALLHDPISNQETLKAQGPSLQKIDHIEFKQLGFQHKESEKPVLNNVNLSIRHGDSIGLIGPSGGGKTTLAELILGLRQPTSGTILINNVPSTQYQDAEKFRHFAYIPQQVFLLDGSFSDNISLFDDGGDVKQRVETAIQNAQLAEYINQLPQGIDSVCGENGAKLSGGQRQRIALARAFYFKRFILVMDEATSALDYDTEKEIIREVRELKGKVTLLVIAHRLEAILDCDRIFKVADGGVVELSAQDIALLRSQ